MRRATRDEIVNGDRYHRVFRGQVMLIVFGVIRVRRDGLTSTGLAVYAIYPSLYRCRTESIGASVGAKVKLPRP